MGLFVGGASMRRGRSRIGAVGLRSRLTRSFVTSRASTASAPCRAKSWAVVREARAASHRQLRGYRCETEFLDGICTYDSAARDNEKCIFGIIPAFAD